MDGTTSEDKSLVKSGHKLAHATAQNSPLVAGRREFFKYRDLGVASASAGQMKAQVMTAIKGMTEPTGWHYHKCDAQFIYIMKGWVGLEFEDGNRKRVNAGESLYIPGVSVTMSSAPQTISRSSKSFCLARWARYLVLLPLA